MRLAAFALIGVLLTSSRAAAALIAAAPASAVLSDDMCPTAAKPLARLGYLMSRDTDQARAQMQEMLDRAYDAELDCSKAAAITYGTSYAIEDLRAALLAKLKLAMLMSWTAETDARSGEAESAHELWLDAQDLALFVYDATTGNPDLTGMRAGAATVSESIASDLEQFREANRFLTGDTAENEVEDGARVVRTQAITTVIETALDGWERRSRVKSFGGVDVIETVDGSTTIQIQTDGPLWNARSTEQRRATFKVVADASALAVPSSPLGYILKLVSPDGVTLVVERVT